MDRRDNPGRREVDPAKIEETTWQEACGHDRKVLLLLQEGYTRFSRATVAALVVMACFVALAILRTIILTADNSARIKDIQQERFHNVLSNCEETNLRNKGTIRELDILVGKAAAAATSRGQAIQIKANEASTVLLIDELAPYHKSCSQFAKQAVVGGSTG